MNYKRIRISRSKTKNEHRIIMEKYLGRELDKDEVVHHINGNKKDNSINNLELMSRATHSRLHLSGKKCSPEEIKQRSDSAFAYQKKLADKIPQGKSWCSYHKKFEPIECFSKDKYMRDGLYRMCRDARKKARSEGVNQSCLAQDCDQV